MTYLKSMGGYYTDPVYLKGMLRHHVHSFEVDPGKEEQVVQVLHEDRYVCIYQLAGVSKLPSGHYMVHLRVAEESYEEARQEHKAHGRSTDHFHIKRFPDGAVLPSLREVFLFYEGGYCYFGWTVLQP